MSTIRSKADAARLLARAKKQLLEITHEANIITNYVMALVRNAKNDPLKYQANINTIFNAIGIARSIINKPALSLSEHAERGKAMAQRLMAELLK